VRVENDFTRHPPKLREMILVRCGFWSDVYETQRAYVQRRAVTMPFMFL
jgi:hypothetical protein